MIFHKRGRNGQLNLLLVPFGNSCTVVCETIPATILFVKTYFENDRSRFQNTNQKNYSYKYAQSSAEGIQNCFVCNYRLFANACAVQKAICRL